jgi:hypothetical protein
MTAAVMMIDEILRLTLIGRAGNPPVLTVRCPDRARVPDQGVQLHRHRHPRRHLRRLAGCPHQGKDSDTALSH